MGRTQKIEATAEDVVKELKRHKRPRSAGDILWAIAADKAPSSQSPSTVQEASKIVSRTRLDSLLKEMADGGRLVACTGAEWGRLFGNWYDKKAGIVYYALPDFVADLRRQQEEERARQRRLDIDTRAHNEALGELRKAHPEEFMRLFEAARARLENEEKDR